jgi:hypothetical protein
MDIWRARILIWNGRKFSFAATHICASGHRFAVSGAGVVAGFSFEVVEGLPDNAVGEAMVGYVATGERQTGDEK